MPPGSGACRSIDRGGNCYATRKVTGMESDGQEGLYRVVVGSDDGYLR